MPGPPDTCLDAAFARGPPRVRGRSIKKKVVNPSATRGCHVRSSKEGRGYLPPKKRVRNGRVGWGEHKSVGVLVTKIRGRRTCRG